MSDTDGEAGSSVLSSDWRILWTTKGIKLSMGNSSTRVRSRETLTYKITIRMNWKKFLSSQALANQFFLYFIYDSLVNDQ